MANRPRGYGFTSEISRKINSKYSPELEQQARQWIEAVLDRPLKEDTDAAECLGEHLFQEVLKDGVLLCELINTLSPLSVKKIHRVQSGPFKTSRDSENISNFLAAIDKYGVSKTDQFQTANLTDRNNGMTHVVNCIHAVGRAARKNKFEGPTLGPKEAEYNPRNFSEEVIQKGKTTIGLQYGFTGGASQKGMNFGKARSIND